MHIAKLQCNYMNNPFGFDLDRPMLHWITEAAGENRRQSAYRIQVSTDESFACPCFDTGRVESGESVGFRLDMPLSPCTRYFWRVNVWDEGGNESGFSASAWFETGRYDRPWQAEWIGSAAEYPQLRKGFRVEKPVRRARAYASGAGLYRLFINGHNAGDDLLTPHFNAYDQWMQYQTWDVTALLQQGDNVVGAWLGNGYYKGRVNWPGLPERRNIYGDQIAFIVELDVEYVDGSRETILTDESWESMPSPCLRAEIYDGEVFDARLFDPDWCRKTGAEGRAVKVDINKALLQARRSLPVRVMHTLPVVRKLTTPAGEQVLDFGQNMAGRIRVTIDAPEGQEVLFQFGEMLDEKGNFYRDNMRTALAELRYISDGTPREYAPNFTFFGFRYVRVTGWDIPEGAIVAEAIYSAMETTGRFECSDERVNQLFRNALWSQRGNFVDIPTDCPQRDERMGWTGDAQVFCPTACMNMETAAFYRKYLYDLRLEQKKVGYVPLVVPYILYGSGAWECASAAWSDAATLMPWDVYLYYGDRSILEEQYESMKAWVDYITAQDTAGNDLFEGYHLGDWLAQDTKDPDNVHGLTPPPLVATAYYAWSAEHVAKAAAVLGNADDVEKYAALAQRVKAAFRREFVTESGRVCAENQTAYLVALNMGMLLPHQREKAIQCLAERLRIDHVQLTTGFVGTPLLCPVLSDAGLNEYAYALLLNNKCPSWLYEVEAGATTIWERWNSRRPDGTMGDVSMNSFNHYAFGAICEWLYRYVAGINPVAEAPGFRRVLVRPRINDMLTHAGASIDTVHGRYSASWQLDEGHVCVTVQVPFNGHAKVMLPDSEGMQVTLNGQTSAPIATEDGCCVYECGSGQWAFRYVPNGQSISRRVW